MKEKKYYENIVANDYIERIYDLLTENKESKNPLFFNGTITIVTLNGSPEGTFSDSIKVSETKD